MILKLTIPKLQRSLNILLRWHWAVFQKEQGVFNFLVHVAYKTQGKKMHFKGKKVAIAYTLYFKDKKKRDLSNYGQKMIDDCLIREGIIDDDNSEIVLEEVVRIRYDKRDPRTEVVITDIV